MHTHRDPLAVVRVISPAVVRETDTHPTSGHRSSVSSTRRTTIGPTRPSRSTPRPRLVVCCRAAPRAARARRRRRRSKRSKAFLLSVWLKRCTEVVASDGPGFASDPYVAMRLESKGAGADPPQPQRSSTIWDNHQARVGWA